MATQGVTLDKVSIEIQSSSSQASQDIDRLTTSLTALRGAIKGGFNGLNKLASSLNELVTSSKQMSDISTNISKLENVTLTLQELSNIPTPTGFKAIIKGLNDLKIASDNLGDTDAKLSGIPNISENLATLGNIPRSNSINSITKNLERLIEISPQLEKVSNDLKTLPSMVAPLSSLQSISVGKGLSSVVNNLERIPEAMQKFDSSTLENVARVSTQLASALTPVANKFRDISAGAGSLSAMANKYGIGITNIREYSKNTIPILSRLKKGLRDVNKNILDFGKGALTSIGGHAVRSFQKAASKAKQLTLALIGTRTIFTLTRKAVSEYLALDQELSKFSTNIWRALGAQLAPAIEYVMGLFKQFVRVIYSFVYAITGVDLIARANAKAMSSWSKSAKDALGNLQKFDDLNVVEFPKSSGDGPNLIDMDKIDLTPIQWLVDAVIRIKEAFKEAFDTGQWNGVGKELANLINEFTVRIVASQDIIFGTIKSVATNIGDIINGWFENINAANLAKTIEIALSIIPTFINTLLEDIDFSQIGAKIDEFLNNINFETLITNFGNIWVNIITGIQDTLSNIDTKTLSKYLEQVLLGFIRSVKNIIQSIDFKELSIKLHDTIVGMDWKTIFKEIGETLKSAFAGLGQTIAGTIFGKEFKSTTAAALLGIGSLISGTIIKIFGSSVVKTLTASIKKLFSLPEISNALEGSEKASGKADMHVPKASTVLKGLADLAIIIGGITALMGVIGLFMKIPGLKEIVTNGLNTVVEVFSGLGKITIPLLVFSAGMVALGAVGIATVALGLAGFATIVTGTVALMGIIGALMSVDVLQDFVATGVTTLIALFTGLESIAVPLGVFSAYILTLGFATPIVALSGIEGFAIIVGGLIGLLTILGELKQIPGFDWILGEGGQVLSTLGETLGNFAGSIIKGFVEKSFEGLESVGTSLSNFMTNATPFFTGLKNIDESSATAAKSMAGAILELTVASLIDGISRFLGIGSKNIESFADQLPYFGKKLKEYGDNVAGLDPGIVEKSANAAKAVTEFAKQIPNQGGLWSWIAGDNTLDDFGKQLPIFGKHFSEYYNNVKDINSDVVTKSADAAKSLSAFAKEIPNSGGLVAIFTGDNSIDKFGAKLKTFGAYFKNYYTSVAGINIDTINTVTESIGKLVAQYKIIKDNKLVNTVTDFGNALKNSAGSIKSFFQNTFSTGVAWDIGYSFGNSFANGIAYALRNKAYPRIKLQSNGQTQASYQIVAGYATGGYPEKGQYFYARENGIPEMVGSIGSQTVVANNMQIVQGIKQGVKEAIQEADFNFTNVVNVGNETLYKKQQAYNKLQNNKYGTINV